MEKNGPNNEELRRFRAEAATLLGKAPGTVKSHLHRALAKLRQELGDLRTNTAGGDDDSSA